MRVIGKRKERPYGLRPPTMEERQWLISLSKFRTHVPKGVFKYKNHEEANRDWEKWMSQAKSKDIYDG